MQGYEIPGSAAEEQIKSQKDQATFRRADPANASPSQGSAGSGAVKQPLIKLLNKEGHLQTTGERHTDHIADRGGQGTMDLKRGKKGIEQLQCQSHDWEKFK
ncbi:hypothetical protein H8F24_05700 [Synechococcus sp. CBW1002]|uniref:hypothetical protein n=1 Tax=Synechococcus sp. CBW1002 TaxID=1353134 RepID=UPI0018CDE826|nr:hypothetical protein [Synechococcus sp. CBW1002]QPN60855.1 hypothetical protein H8F24_05700 [Synechococcus sp. CBW1002]